MHSTFSRAAAIAIAATIIATTAHAQTEQVQVTFIPVARLDLIAGSNTALQAGLGITTPISSYVAIGGTAAAGISRTGFSTRADLYGRFSLDPYHQYYWEPYLGAGASLRYDSGRPGSRTYLLGFLGLDGPSAGGVAPGVELGFGGGVRLGVTLRWASTHVPSTTR